MFKVFDVERLHTSINLYNTRTMTLKLFDVYSFVLIKLQLKDICRTSLRRMIYTFLLMLYFTLSIRMMVCILINKLLT